MSSKPLQKLHFATSVEELQEKANFNAKALNEKGTSMLCKSAHKLLKEAEKHYSANDEEMAYVYFFKFVDLIVNIRNRVDFSKNPLSKTLLESANSAIDKAGILKKSLLERYAALEEAELKIFSVNKVTNQVDNMNKINKEKEFSEKDTLKSSDLVIDTALEHSISAQKLYSLILDGKSSFVMMDTRPSEDFEESHIKHRNCISIPSEILTPGITGKQLERQLPADSVEKWGQRTIVDYVIIIDWDTTDTCLPTGHPLRTLEEAMCKWEMQKPLNKPPLILTGGYKEWVLRYPMHATKALDIHVLDPPKEVSYITDVSVIDFPDFDTQTLDENDSLVDNNMKNAGLKDKLNNGWMAKPLIDRKNKPREQMNSVFSKLTDPDIPLKLTDKPNAAVDISSVKFFQPVNVNNQPAEKIKFMPEVNRRLKPLLSDPSDATTNLKPVTQPKENDLSQLRLRKELEAEEAKRMALQSNEEKLIESLKKLEMKSQEKDAKVTALEAENVRVKQLLEAKKVEAKERENANDSDERLHQQKKSTELQNKVAKTDTGKSVSELKGEEVSKGEYTVSLKRNDSSTDSGSRGLTRSYSSPNIAQLNAEPVLDNRKKLPLVDRSLKPNIIAPVSDSHLRIRNLSPIYGNIPARPVTGLKNLGNTCFMNSIIQSLSNTVQLANYFTTEEYRHHLRKAGKTYGEVAEEFAVVMRALWMGGFKSIAPKDFKMTLSKYVPMFAGNEQQDSHEFLVVLMDKLHTELNQGSTGDPQPDIESLPDNVAVETFWNHHRKANCSKISETFEGLLKSTLACLSCGKSSNNFEVFSCLPLPLLKSTRLEECFENFLKPENMSGWFCPKCKQKKEARKTMMFCRLPNVLILQLKRFSFEGRWRRKLPNDISLPYILDTLPGRKYELYAVVNHYGFLEGGHYTAFCKNSASSRWYKYDDHEVTEITTREVQSPAAYLVFYSARDDLS